ncbi:MAG: oxidoreductase [Micrococcales bacterium]|nr:oxidoreductase [Micrococcales bacterium]
MSKDPLAALTSLPGVAEAAEEARAAVDQLLWDRVARRKSNALAVESTVVGAWCNAAFEGAEVLLDSLRTGAVEDSPMGLTAMRTLAMYAEIPGSSDLVTSAPLQAIARLHAVVAVGSTPEEQLGRPRNGEELSDPLRLGEPLSATELPIRLQGLSRLLTTETAAPAIVLAGVLHAELASIRPFAVGSGAVARASTRLILRAKGVDPDGWSFPEAGLRTLGRNKYVAAIRSYASGEPEGVAEWLTTHSRTVTVGARAASDELAQLPEDE